jgi:hypothetical protein
MKKLIIALGLISILAATTVPSWGKDKPIYVCYLEKKNQARVVKKTKDCKRPEMAIALNKIEPNTAADQDLSKRAREVARKYPTWTQSSVFSTTNFSRGRYRSSSNR